MNSLQWKEWWRQQRLNRKDEIWKQIEGYEGLYEISSIGRVKSLHHWSTKLLKLCKCWNWYINVNLCKNWISISNSVHKLVWYTFIENTLNKLDINHKNWIKTDNRVDNLEWNTRSENMKHAYRTWLSKANENHHFKINHPMKGKFWKNHNRAKKVYQYSLDRVLIKQWDSMMDIQREIWIDQRNISYCCKSKNNIFWWYIWMTSKEAKDLLFNI